MVSRPIANPQRLNDWEMVARIRRKSIWTRPQETRFEAQVQAFWWKETVVAGRLSEQDVDAAVDSIMMEILLERLIWLLPRAKSLEINTFGVAAPAVEKSAQEWLGCMYTFIASHLWVAGQAVSLKRDGSRRNGPTIPGVRRETAKKVSCLLVVDCVERYSFSLLS